MYLQHPRSQLFVGSEGSNKRVSTTAHGALQINNKHTERQKSDKKFNLPVRYVNWR